MKKYYEKKGSRERSNVKKKHLQKYPKKKDL